MTIKEQPSLSIKVAHLDTDVNKALSTNLFSLRINSRGNAAKVVFKVVHSKESYAACLELIKQNSHNVNFVINSEGVDRKFSFKDIEYDFDAEGNLDLKDFSVLNTLHITHKFSISCTEF